MAKSTENTETTEAKRTQVSTTLSPAELEIVKELRWSGRHDKLSDVVHAGLAALAEQAGSPFPTA